ncbi:hypothetical protein PYW08_001259 [Mythimna loreyi]|uniref:Uncharacterized protein n=1 Tax=Mythimna loreyi TaxID=667449 RepID=A0ACC2R046_9NEOP|nr:hypothetical protein PYW08_001259 [Mythimna loreyi]
MTEAKEVVAESNGEENNKKEESLDEETSDLESSIIRQVEYYFGDLNLPRDKFLREQVTLDEGWVPLDILTRFNRLAKLTKDTEIIAKALNKATNGLLEVSEDNKKVRRSPDVPIPEMNEERRKELSNRTIYAKGFPKDATLDDLLKHFKKYDQVENIIMRKFQERSSKKRMFKGSVFITFKTREQAEKFMEGKPHEYQETELIILWQDDYIAQKQEEYANKKEQKDKRNKDKDNNVEKEELKLPTGTVLHFSGGTDQMKREDIKEALSTIGADIAYIDFKVGDKEGWVRLTKEDTAKGIAEKMTDNKMKIAEADVEFKVLEGEEETTYLQKTVEEMTKRRKNMKNFKSNKGRKGGNKYHGKKRRHDNEDSGNTKKIRTSDS